MADLYHIMPGRVESVGVAESPHGSGLYGVFIFTSNTTYDQTGERMTEDEALGLAAEVADLAASGFTVTAANRWRTS